MELPNQCPICHKDWELFDEASGVGIAGLFVEWRCPQYDQCNCCIYENTETAAKEWLCRLVGEFEIWWDIQKGIEYRHDGELFRVDFDLPFDVDEERLKLLLAFS